MFKYPDQVAAFWHRSGHVVETTGAGAIAEDVAEGGHRVVLNEVSNRMILPRGALVKGASSVLPKAMRAAKTPSADAAVNLPSEALLGFGFSLTCISARC
jgi:hypothetical protein